MRLLDILLSAVRSVWHPHPNLRFCTPPPPHNISINSMLGPSNGPPHQAIFFAVFAVM